MKAIVLAAGLGSRMLPLTGCLHKSLLPVAGSTILGRIVDGLLAIDVRDIFVVTGYLSDQVRSFLSEHYPDTPFTFIHNARYRETNNIVSLAMALDQVPYDSDIVLIECDVLFEPKLLRCLTTPERGNIALVDRYRPGMDGTVVSVEKGIITQVFPPHLDYRDKYKTVNIYRFDREFCRTALQPLLSCYANIIDSNCYYELVLGMLINMQRETVRAEMVDGRQWAEIDDPNDLTAARFAFEPESRGEILERAWGGHWNFGILDFTFPRNVYFPTTAMIAAMRRGLPDVVRSYGSSQEVLNEKMAYALKCKPERVECLHGAAQIFPLLPDLLHAAWVLLPVPIIASLSKSLGVPGASVFDVGCGSGAYLFELHQIGCRVAGLDASSALIRYANAVMPSGHWVCADATELDISEPYDFVVASAVFLYFPSQDYSRRVLERMVVRHGMACWYWMCRISPSVHWQWRSEEERWAKRPTRGDTLGSNTCILIRHGLLPLLRHLVWHECTSRISVSRVMQIQHTDSTCSGGCEKPLGSNFHGPARAAGTRRSALS